MGRKGKTEREQSRKNRSVFFCSLGVTLFVLILGAGIVAVDYQGRRMSFGDDTPPFHIEETSDGRAELEIRLLGQDKRVDVTTLENFRKFLCDFGCIPHK